jgi:hypothetical protein
VLRAAHPHPRTRGSGARASRGDGRRDILITVVDEENARRLDVYRGLGTGSFQTPWCECVLPRTLFTRGDHIARALAVLPRER